MNCNLNSYGRLLDVVVVLTMRSDKQTFEEARRCAIQMVQYDVSYLAERLSDLQAYTRSKSQSPL